MATRDYELPLELLSLLPAELHAQCDLRLFERGQRLFQTGRRPAWMHFVSSGEVVLQRIGEDGELVVLQRTQHGFVGEASLHVERYHCDAVVVASAQVTRVPRQALQDALRTDAGFGLRWIDMLNRELRRLRQQCERLSLKTVEARLLHLLRTDGATSGLAPSGGLKALAHELGVTHEALYRCVAQMEKRGQVTRDQGRLRLRAATV
jgi:CRP-like cAMP-binding protein